MSAIVPKLRPQMTEEEVRRLIAGHDLKGSKVIFVGIRGYYKKTMGNPVTNDVGIYDDAIFILTPDGMKAYNANTDPSVLRKGIAVLKEGLHWYKKGLHGISKGAGKAYPAFRPASKDEGVPVTRDGKDSRGIAINMHKGGYHQTSSEGCQTIYPDQWQEFQTTAYAELDKYAQKEIPYILTQC